MGKRGPAPKGDYEGKSQVLSTRIRPDTRAMLVEAAAASGRSLSQEIEHRLRRGFDSEQMIKASFGSRRNYRLMQLVALSTQVAIDPGPDFRNADAETDWLDDPTSFEMARRMILGLL